MGSGVALLSPLFFLFLYSNEVEQIKYFLIPEKQKRPSVALAIKKPKQGWQKRHQHGLLQIKAAFVRREGMCQHLATPTEP